MSGPPGTASAFTDRLPPGTLFARQRGVITTESLVPGKAYPLSAPARSFVTGSERRVLRVWVADDNAALRVLFAQLLNQQPTLRCTGQFPSANAVLAALAEERPPDVVLLDANLQGQGGLRAIRRIKKMARSVKVLMLAMFSSSWSELQALRAGASGFLLRSYEFDDIVRLIREAHRNPGAPCLFPSLPLRQAAESKQAAQEGIARAAEEDFSLVAALRGLCGVQRRQRM